MSVVLLFDPAREEELRGFLVEKGFRMDERPHALLFAAREGVSLTAYQTGKVLLGGAQAEEFAGVLVGHGLARRDVVVTGPFTPHAGSDESGKGDYFGPLVVAAVHVPDRSTAEALVKAGVRDSKVVGLGNVGPLASLVRERCATVIVSVPPPRYNELYERIGNLNDLLAWAHARAIEDLLAKVGVVPVVVDEFARGVLRRHLMERGRKAVVKEMPRAETDVPVAAASIVARAEFLASLAQLEARYGLKLPRGAGPAVMQVARELAGERGFDVLRETAKLHFTTTRGVLLGN